MRRIAVITGTRADYGLLYWIIKGICEDSGLELQLLVTGMQLSPEFGFTVKDIEKDGFPITDKIEMLLSSDTETAISTSMGLGMIGFAKAYERLRPDILLVLGDRFEILSAVAAAVPFRIPVAHIHGGELTEGAIDERFRHAITKMSHIHFTAAEEYRKRVMQMGEQPDNVFCYGAPGLDSIHNLLLMNKEELLKVLGVPADKKIGIFTYHPATLERAAAEIQMQQLLYAIQGFNDIYWIFTLPNADTGGRIIIRMIEEFIYKHPEQGKVFASLGQLRYLSVQKHAELMVGNSSSGLIEAPSFELPVVNVGYRQKGRIRGINVIDALKCEKEVIENAIKQALSPEFRKSLSGMKNPYGEGDASIKIIEKLKSIELDESLIKKRFYEMVQ